LETVRICVGYRYGGEVLTDFPEEERIWDEAEPVYEELSGWQTSTHGMRDYAELPSKAREYVERLAELIGVGFSLVSTGAVRDETILVNDSVLTRWFPALRSALPAH
jgi:adenylosuccinate synthase